MQRLWLLHSAQRLLRDDPVFSKWLARSFLAIAFVVNAGLLFSHYRGRVPNCAVLQARVKALAAHWSPWSMCTTKEQVATRSHDRLKSAAVEKQAWLLRLNSVTFMTKMWNHALTMRLIGLVIFGDRAIFWASYNSAVLSSFCWFIIGACGVACSRRLTPAMVDAFVVANIVVLMAKLSLIPDLQTWQSAHPITEGFRLILVSQIGSLPLSLVVNVGVTLRWFAQWRALGGDTSDIPTRIFSDLLICAFGILFSILRKRRTERAAQIIVDALWTNRQLTAAHAMLHATYAVVLDLDEELRFVSDEGGRMLAAFLLHWPHSSAFKQGAAFSAVLGKGNGKEFEALFAASTGDQPVAKSFSVTLRDGNGSALPIDILAVACEAGDFRQGFLVGIRESDEERSQLEQAAKAKTQYFPHPAAQRGALAKHLALSPASQADWPSNPSTATSSASSSSSVSPRSVASAPAASSSPKPDEFGASLSCSCLATPCVWRACTPPGERRSSLRSPGSMMAASGSRPSRCGRSQQQQQQRQKGQQQEQQQEQQPPPPPQQMPKKGHEIWQGSHPELDP